MAKQFCARGHDTFIVGRSKARSCKSCMAETGANWRTANAERQRENGRKWVAANGEKYSAGRRVRSWKKRGIIISNEEYAARLSSQEGRCAICRIEAKDVYRALCVDHDHVTGKVRGLLCYKCNSGLGFFRDDARLVSKAISYLETI